MIYALCVLAAVLVVPFVVLFVTVLPWRRLVSRSVVVVLDDERTISGVLWKRSGRLLMIRAAQVATDQGPVAADGVLVVERSRVLWIQVTD